MIYGLYLSAQGAEAQAMRIDVIANNLANASTNGFKRDFPFFQTHATFDELNGLPVDVTEDQLEQTGGIAAAGVATDHSPGPLQSTQGDFDLAIGGEGFFRVVADGKPALTRDGQFTLNDRGELVTLGNGYPVLGNNGQPVVFPADTRKAQFNPDGTIQAFDSVGLPIAVGELDIVRPESYEQLVKVGNNLLAGGGRLQPAPTDTQVLQGYLEGSGTNSVMEMVQLIEASREFETNLNMLRLQDDAMGRLLQAVPLRG